MISVAMATYNGAKFIEKQLDSIFNQTLLIDELVIVDDCSTDQTVEIIRQYQNKYPSVKINLVLNETNIGYKKNFYKAISSCTGDYILLCDQDDIWKKDKVEILYNLIKSNPQIAIIASTFDEINEDDQVITKNKNLYSNHLKEKQIFVPLQDLIFHNIAQGCAMIMTKRIKELYLENFTEKLPHDRILNVIAAMNDGLLFYNKSLFSYRIHSNNTIGLADSMKFQQKNKLQTRILDAEQAIEVLQLIQRVDGTFYENNEYLCKMYRFAQNHVNAIKNNDFIKLLFQSANPYYKKLKSFKGRILDLYFVLRKGSN